MSSAHIFTPEKIVQANGIDICYQTLGDPKNPPILLVMGLGVQMIGWPDEFCEMLATQGFYVIRFDNRDVGLSTHVSQAARPRRRQMVGNFFFGRSFEVAYTLEDMASDTVALLDALNIERVHIVGVSMGGMISQLVAINHPERLYSLTSIMSTTGERDLPNSTPKALSLLMRPRANTFEGFLNSTLATYRYFNQTAFDFDTERMTGYITRSFNRSNDPQGLLRQMAAISNATGRRKPLRNVSVPSLIIHGDADPLVPYAHGVDTAEAIPSARLFTIRGMGHALPSGAWPTMTGEIARHAKVNTLD